MENNQNSNSPGNWGSKVWLFISSAFALVLSLLFLQSKRAKDAESKLESAEYKKNDAVLADRIDQGKINLQKEQEALEEEKKKNLSTEELAAYFKDKK